MSVWKEYKLGEICKVKGGKRLPKGKNLTTVPNSHPYIRVRDMGEKYLPINNLEYVPNEIFPSIKNYIVDKGDLLLSIVGTVGLVSLVNDELDKASLTENCVKIIPQKDIIDNEFLYYFLKSNIGQEEIFRKIVGAVQPKLPIYNINDIGLNIPDLPTQTAIAEILSSLDDKIELNNKINQELETLAQTLFKQWFIDFEFPNENGEPYKSSCGEMVDSELGEIPKGWDRGIFSDLVKISSGKGIHKKDYVENGGYPIIGANGIMGNYFKYNIDGFKILTGRVGTLGTVRISIEKAWISDNVLICEPIKKEFNHYSYFVMKNFDYDALNRGSTQPLITQTDLKSQSVNIPPMNVLSQFQNQMDSILLNLEVYKSENKKLISLSNTLLPKLISGELEINEISN
jgi:type I restriction enzyme S subunit